MKNIYLILTVDYELFGNGLGSVCECILDPADRMIAIADPFGIPLTFFVEPLEIMAMEAEKKYAKIVGEVINQMRGAVKKGHDVQLHLHPQWKNAMLSKEGDWIVDNSRWRIGNCSSVEIREYIAEGKKWIESVCLHVLPNYQCIAFRAGGWCIQPSDLVISALRDCGFSVDSTVAPGLYNVAKGEWSDFRYAPNLPFWKVSDDVCQYTDTGLLEVPIVTGKIGWLSHLCALRHSRGSGNLGLAPGCVGSYMGPDGRYGIFMTKLSKLARLGHVMLDFSTMPAHILIDVTKQWIEKNRNITSPLPIVAIAHTKNFTTASEVALKEYLFWARDEGIIFSTFKQWLNAKNCGKHVS